jgi:NAD(P)-dependent dehydrogenase (short-subunit alcohol dehydrogenase family)
VNADTDSLQAVKELQSKHGIEHIDIVLANAGYYTNDQGFTTLSYEEAEKVWKINVSHS